MNPWVPSYNIVSVFIISRLWCRKNRNTFRTNSQATFSGEAHLHRSPTRRCHPWTRTPSPRSISNDSNRGLVRRCKAWKSVGPTYSRHDTPTVPIPACVRRDICRRGRRISLYCGRNASSSCQKSSETTSTGPFRHCNPIEKTHCRNEKNRRDFNHQPALPRVFTSGSALWILMELHPSYEQREDSSETS